MFTMSMRKDEPPAPVSGSLASTQSIYQKPTIQEGFFNEIVGDWWPENNGRQDNELPDIDAPNQDSMEDGKNQQISFGLTWAAVAVVTILGVVYWKKGRLL